MATTFTDAYVKALIAQREAALTATAQAEAAIAVLAEQNKELQKQVDSLRTQLAATSPASQNAPASAQEVPSA